LRHPYIRDHIAEGVIFWSHHEKMVIVDQTLALFGGMQSCAYMRYKVIFKNRN